MSPHVPSASSPTHLSHPLSFPAPRLPDAVSRAGSSITDHDYECTLKACDAFTVTRLWVMDYLRQRSSFCLVQTAVTSSSAVGRHFFLLSLPITFPASLSGGTKRGKTASAKEIAGQLIRKLLNDFPFFNCRISFAALCEEDCVWVRSDVAWNRERQPSNCYYRHQLSHSETTVSNCRALLPDERVRSPLSPPAAAGIRDLWFATGGKTVWSRERGTCRAGPSLNQARLAFTAITAHSVWCGFAERHTKRALKGFSFLSPCSKIKEREPAAVLVTPLPGLPSKSVIRHHNPIRSDFGSCISRPAVWLLQTSENSFIISFLSKSDSK